MMVATTEGFGSACTYVYFMNTLSNKTSTHLLTSKLSVKNIHGRRIIFELKYKAYVGMNNFKGTCASGS